MQPGTEEQLLRRQIEQLEQEMLKLSAEERVALAERVLANAEVEAEVERAWLAEVRRRDAELDDGAEAIPMDEALATVRERFGW